MRHPAGAAGLLLAAASLSDLTRAAQLPIPCAAGTCGSFVGYGTVAGGQPVTSGSKLTVTQTSANAVLNWKSFNISADGTVQFVQPSTTSVALNQIFQGSPSQIFGSLQANGQIFLINQNGIIFGSTAQVSVGSLVASSLMPYAPSSQPYFTALNGLTGALGQGQAAFSGSSSSGAIQVQQGASIQTPEGGTILMFAPNVTNQGTLQAPGGQVMLAAGESVYLASSTDPTLRGLLVEVSGNGAVTNGDTSDANVTSPQQLVGQIVSEHGNVTLAALAVNQDGLVSATTTVRENGSIVLQARSGSIANGSQFTSNETATSTPQNGFSLDAGTGGSLTLGPHSVTAVTLETSDTETTVDSVPQPQSDVKMFATNVQIQDAATVTATSGIIDVTALANQSANPVGTSSQSDGSIINIAPDATLDVSGATVDLPASSIVIPVQLRGTELADFPLQRNGPLRGDTVYVDSLLYGTRADGSTWVGTPLADVSGEIASIPRDVAERNLTGGSISLESQGDVVVASGATLNVSGGATNYSAGYLDTTQLVTAAGTVVDISQADPNLLYTGIASPTTTVSDAKWGVTTTYNTSGAGPSRNYQPAFTEGADAGTVTLLTPRFVLDGTIDGQATVGQYQRLAALPDNEWPSNNVNIPFTTLYRPYDEVPLSGELVIGASNNLLGSTYTEFVQNGVTFASQTVLAGLEASGFDPSVDQLPSSYVSVLRPDLFGPQGIGRLELYSDGTVTVPSGTSLSLPGDGLFDVSAHTIDIDGSIDVPGGNIALAASWTNTNQPDQNDPDAPSMQVGPDAALTARGAWVNDSVQFNPNGPSGPLFLNGGTIGLSVADGNLTLDPGSLIDVSGGAQLTTSGQLAYGSGGKISLAVSPLSAQGSDEIAPTALSIGGTLRGYGALEGGSLKLVADTVCIAPTDCSGGDPSVLWLPPAFFQQNGFASYDIESSLNGLTVAPGTVIDLVQQNLVPPTRPGNIPSAPAFEPLASLETLPALNRQPTNLILAANIGLPSSVLGGGLNDAQMAAEPSLEVGDGAAIVADPAAQIALESNTRIIDDGTIEAPAGKVSMTLSATLPLVGYDVSQTQGIWLGPDAVVDAAGVAQIAPNDSSLTTGTVLGGGAVSIDAEQGYFEMLPGSLIDVSGTSAQIVQLQFVGSAMRPVAMIDASAGGSVSLEAAEGMTLGGTFRAAGGTGATRTPAGGSLSVALDPSQRTDNSPTTSPPTFPVTPRDIVLEPDFAPVVVGPGQAVPDSLDGEALIPANELNSAGFDNLSFRAVTYLASGVNGGTQVMPGTITAPQNVTLQAGDSITMDAAIISVNPGATATLTAPYVSLGNSDILVSDFQSPTSGTGTLNVNGSQLIELYGTLALQGVGQANLVSSDGDIRVRGLQLPVLDATGAALPSDPTGAFLTAGNLELQAAQIFPTTLTQFTISSNAANGTIDIEKSGASPDSVWSAGGSLTLSAANITQNGDVRAPFGTITIEGPPGNVNTGNITLGPGSLTSTSADGLTIPFGTTQAGTSWTYPLEDGTYFVYGAGTGEIAPPAQQINLVGANINVQGSGTNKATIDVSGGGDLLAYEFQPDTTTGGNVDILASGGASPVYAIVPTLNSSVAPYDPNISSGSTLQLGASVYLAGAPGLPAGTYTLLPARYALLDGGFLVEPVKGYTGITPGQQYLNPGGGTIVAGYNTVAGTGIADANTSGFAVIPASVFDQEATYTTTLASQFFSAQAQGSSASSAPAFRLPGDAGVLALVASQQLALDGTLTATAQSGGLGAEVDIASANLDVVPDGGTATTPGTIAITASSLQQLGAQSLLLGGQRTGTDITTDAQTVVISPGALLTAPDILLAASDEVDVAKGASLVASGTAPPPTSYELTGNAGAFLEVSTSPIGSLTRAAGASTSGTVDLESGSQISAPQGSLSLSGGTVSTNGTLALTGADLGVQSAAIDLGSAPTGGAGSGVTVLGPSVLDAADLRSLSLTSGSGISIDGSVTVDAQNLTLDGPGILAGSNGATAVLTASGTLTLSNLQNAVASATTGSGGTITFNAQNIELGASPQLPSSAGGSGSAGQTPLQTGPAPSQNVTISGFSTVALNAQDELSANANSALSTPSSLELTATRITTASGVTLGITAGGALTVGAPQKPASLAPAAGVGGTLQLQGQSVALDTDVELPAGSVQLASTGGTSGSDVVLGSAATIDVAGVTHTYDGIGVAAPGGTVDILSAGNVLLSAGSVIDVSGAPGGDAGSLSVTATAGNFAADGTLKGAAGSGGQGGSFSVNAGSLDGGNFLGLLHTVTSAGFQGDLSFELHGTGNLDLAAGTSLKATDVALIADQGSVTVEGAIDVSGSSGGDVLLAAADNIALSGTIDAHATGAGQSGGQVDMELSPDSAGTLTFGNTASINVSGGPANAYGNTGQGGLVLARVPQTTVEALTAGGTGVTWQGSVVGASQTILEAAHTAYSVDGTLTTTEETSALADATAFMTNAQSILSHLNAPSGSAPTIEPGIEFDDTDSSSPLELTSAWNLYTARFNGDGTPGDGIPGILTLRAAGGITFDASLSDGFAAAAEGTRGTGATSVYTLLPTDSWSYRLVAGADFTSANVLAVTPTTVAAAEASTAPGIVIGNGAMVRTGTGFIDVASAGDLTLASQSSVLYTAGTTGPGTVLSYNAPINSIKLPYPTDGGDISINVAGDVVGAASNQLYSAWLWRTGDDTGTKQNPVAWSVNFEYFQQGVGALGGGSVDVTAGGDIDNLSVSIPSIGRQVGDTADPGGVDVTGDGVLNVQAGGSIAGGNYYVGLGTARIAAGGDITSAPSAGSGAPLAPVLGVGDAQFTVDARGSVSIDGIVNPTLVPEVSLNSPQGQSYFSTYSPDASVSLLATSGDISISANVAGITAATNVSVPANTNPGTPETPASPETPWNTANEIALNVLPPSLRATALDGSIYFSGVLGLFPAPKGNLELLAQNNVIASYSAGSGGVDYDAFILSDADPTLLPSIAQPSESLDAFQYLTLQAQQLAAGASSGQSASTEGISPDALIPVHSLAAQPDGQPDLTPVEVVAATGDIDFSAPVDAGGSAAIVAAKPTRVIAGGDITDLGLVAQNLTPSDVTTVSAGGNITYGLPRTASGTIATNYQEIAVDGPGALDITAGGSLNLETSSGILTRGNLVNSALPAGGANVNITVGTGINPASVSSFITNFVDGTDEFDSQVVAYMEGITGTSNLSVSQAKADLNQLPASEQLAFAQYALAPQYATVISQYIYGSTTYDAALVAYVEQLTGQTGLSASAAKSAFQGLSAELQDNFVDQVVFTAMNTDATQAVRSGSQDYSGAFAALTALFPGANPNVAAGQTTPYEGDIELYFSQIYTLAGGDISLLAPGGEINVGLATPPSAFGITKQPQQLGLVAEGTGDINAVEYSDFEVNESRVFAANGGNIMVWSTEGDIDAGRGAKTSISAPPPTITIGPNGQPIVSFPTALTGSGIQALATTIGVSPGTVSLFAPHGVVNANDAGIVAGNLTIGATAVLGANNISVSGTAIGLPPPPPAIAASLAGATGTASAASSAAQEAVQDAGRSNQSQTPAADAALNFLDVFVTGLGEQNCKPDDMECLKREQGK